MNILSIDVGIINLAIVGILLADDYLERDEIIKFEEIFLCELVDITELMRDCDDTSCEFCHDKIICDYMMHLFKKYQVEFATADLILIERQPLIGNVAVQELIMREYRKKSKLISPTAMLNFFGILHYEYEERKVHTVKIATKYLNGFKSFVFNTRKHDLSDALCILYYHLSMERKKYMENKIKEENKIKFSKLISDLEQFRYTGSFKI